MVYLVHCDTIADEEDLTPLLPERIVGGEDLEVTTPVVEIEQPLLSAPEVSDLARHTRLDLLLEGMVLTLLGEEDDPLAVSVTSFW